MNVRNLFSKHGVLALTWAICALATLFVNYLLRNNEAYRKLCLFFEKVAPWAYHPGDTFTERMSISNSLLLCSLMYPIGILLLVYLTRTARRAMYIDLKTIPDSRSAMRKLLYPIGPLLYSFATLTFLFIVVFRLDGDHGEVPHIIFYFPFFLVGFANVFMAIRILQFEPGNHKLISKFLLITSILAVACWNNSIYFTIPCSFLPAAFCGLFYISIMRLYREQ